MKTAQYLIMSGNGNPVKVPPRAGEWRINWCGVSAWYPRLFIASILNKRGFARDNTKCRHTAKARLYRHCGKYYRQTLQTGHPAAFLCGLTLKRHDGFMNPDIMKTVVLKTRKGVKA